MKRKKNSGKQKKPRSDEVLHRTFHEPKTVPVPPATHCLAHKLRSLSVFVTDITKGDSLQLLGLEQQGHGVWRIQTNLGKSTRCLRMKRGNSVTTSEETSSKSADTLGSKNNNKAVKAIEVVAKTDEINLRKRKRGDSGDGDDRQSENKRTTRRNAKDVVVQEVVSLVSSDNESDSLENGLSATKVTQTRSKQKDKQVKLGEDESESKIKDQIVTIRTGYDMQISAKIKLDSGIRLRSRQPKPISVLPSIGKINEKLAPPEVKSNKNVQNEVSVDLEEKNSRRNVWATQSSAVEDNVSLTEGRVEKICLRVRRKANLSQTSPVLNENDGQLNVIRRTSRSGRILGSKKISSEEIINDVPPLKMTTRKRPVKSSPKAEQKSSDQEVQNVSKKKADGDEENNSDEWNVSGVGDGTGKLKISRRIVKKGTLFWCTHCGLELHSLQNKLEHEFTHIEPRELFVTLHRCSLQSSFINVPTYVSREELAALKSPQEDSCSSVGSVEGRPRLLVEDVINHEEYNAYDYDYSSDGSFSGDQKSSTVDDINVESSQNCESTSNGIEGSPMRTPEKVDCKSPNSSIEGSRDRSKKKSHTKMRLWDGPPTTRSGRVVKISSKSWENIEKMACSKALFLGVENEGNADEETTKEAEDLSEKICQPIDEYVEVVPMKSDSKDTADTSVLSSETSEVIESCAIDGETSQESNTIVKELKEKVIAAKANNELNSEHTEKCKNDISAVELTAELLESDHKLEDAIDTGSFDKNDVDSASVQEKPTISSPPEEVNEGPLAADGDENPLSNMSNEMHPFDEVLGNNIATEDGTCTQVHKHKSDEEIIPGNENDISLKVADKDETMEEIGAVGCDQKAAHEVTSNEITSKLTFDRAVEGNNTCGIQDSDLAVESDEVGEIPHHGIADGLVEATNDDDGCKDVMLTDSANIDTYGSLPDGTIKGQISTGNNFGDDDEDVVEDRFNGDKDGLEDISDGEWEDMNDSDMQGQDGVDISGEPPDVEMIEALEDVSLSKDVNQDGQMDIETDKSAFVSGPTGNGEAERNFVGEEEMEEAENENEMEAENGSDKKSDLLGGEEIDEREEMPVEVNMADDDEDPEDGGMMGLIDSVEDAGLTEVDGIYGEDEGESIIHDQEYRLDEQDEVKGSDVEHGSVDKEGMMERLVDNGDEECGQDVVSGDEVENRSDAYLGIESKPPLDGREYVTLIENVENINKEYCTEKEKINEVDDDAIVGVRKDTVDSVAENLEFTVQSVRHTGNHSAKLLSTCMLSNFNQSFKS